MWTPAGIASRKEVIFIKSGSCTPSRRGMLSANSPGGCQAMFELGPEYWIYFFFFPIFFFPPGRMLD